jgi:transcriptional regulator with XRE-family HTH domain
VAQEHQIEAGATPLAALRRRMPWTQQELAAAAGVSVGTVRGIERGAYQTARPRVIRALAAALGVPPAAIAEFRPSLGLPPAAADALPSAAPGAAAAPRDAVA